uniref:hypothetical protein n=1 Tax=Mariniphaga sediminis TaxID=1628158 RepID=UPI00403639A5
VIRLRSKSVIIFANYGFDHYFLRVNNQNPACLPASSTRCQNQSAPVKQAIFAKEQVAKLLKINHKQIMKSKWNG